MSFLEKIGFVETAEQEAQRLAQSPEGSANHELSKLPVTIEQWPQDLLIELPWHATERGSGHRVVVVPRERAAPAQHEPAYSSHHRPHRIREASACT